MKYLFFLLLLVACGKQTTNGGGGDGTISATPTPTPTPTAFMTNCKSDLDILDAKKVQYSVTKEESGAVTVLCGLLDDSNHTLGAVLKYYPASVSSDAKKISQCRFLYAHTYWVTFASLGDPKENGWVVAVDDPEGSYDLGKATCEAAP